MSFTTAKVIAWNEVDGRGLAEDHYKNVIQFSAPQLTIDDLIVIRIGTEIIVNDLGTVEVATNSFVRWIERTRETHEADTVVISVDMPGMIPWE